MKEAEEKTFCHGITRNKTRNKTDSEHKTLMAC